MDEERFSEFVKKSLSFSIFENPRKSNIIFEEVGYMKGLSKIIVSLILLVALLGIGIFVFYEDIQKFALQISTEEKGKIPVETVVEKEESQKVYQEALISMVVGDVWIVRSDLKREAEVGDKITIEDTLMTGDDSYCEIQIPGKGVVRVEQNSKIKSFEIAKLGDKIDSSIELVKGNIKTAVSKLKGDTLNVKTPTAVAAVRGTVFMVSVSDKGESKVVVTEGKVAVKVRVKTIEKLAGELKTEEVKDTVLKSLEITEIEVEKDKEITITPEVQKKIEQKAVEIVEKNKDKIVELDEKIAQQKSTQSIQEEPMTTEYLMELIKFLPKEIKSTTEKIKITPRKVNPIIAESINKSVSKDMVISSEANTAKLSVVAEGNRELIVIIENVEIGRTPVEKILEKDKEYNLKVLSADRKKVVYSEDVKLSKDTQITIPLKDAEDVKEIQALDKAKVNIVSVPANISPNLSVSRSVVTISKGLIIPSSSSVKIVDTDGNLKSISTGKFSTLSYEGKYIIVVDKSDEGNTIAKVFNINGKKVLDTQLSSETRGSIYLGRPVVIGDNVFVPSINGLTVISIPDGKTKFLGLGNIYSDLMKINGKVVAVNESGELFEVSVDGSYKKVKDMDTQIARKSVSVYSSDKAYLLSGSKLFIISKDYSIETISLDSRYDNLHLQNNNLILTSGSKLLILSTTGKIKLNVVVNSSINGLPVILDENIYVPTENGVFVYNFDGKKLRSYDVIGVGIIKEGNKLIVVGTDNIYTIEE